MNYIIYIYGDMNIFADLFAALSALFNPIAGGANGFVNTAGGTRGVGTAVAVAAMFALMTNLTSYLQIGKLEPHKAIYGLAVYLVFWVPTVDTIYIADLNSAAPSSTWVAVDDVPIGLATIGFGLSNISRTMNGSLQNDLSTGSVGGLTFTSVAHRGHGIMENTGFLSPLKALMSLRESAMMSSKRIDTNIYFFGKYCAGKAAISPTHTGIDFDQISSSSDPLGYLFDTTKIPNTATKKVDDFGSTTIVGCHDLANELNGAETVPGSIRHFVRFGPNANAAKFRGITIENNQSLLSSTVPINSANVDNTFTNELGRVLGSLGVAQSIQLHNFMRLRVKIAEHSSNLSDTTVDSYSMVMSQNLDTARMQAAVQGENFLHWSFSAMTGLLFLFYALFPLIGVVMVAKGGKAIEFLGSYIIFGLWVYSWQTIAIIINYWSTSNFMQYANILNNYQTMSIDMVELYINAASDAVAVGSNLLASVPLITYAVLTGSMFAMTQLSSVATPKGDVGRSVDNHVPALGTNKPLVGMQGLSEQTIGGVNHGTHTAARPILDGVNLSNVFSSSSQATTGYNHTEGAQRQLTSSMRNLSNLIQSSGGGTGRSGLSSIVSSNGNTVNDGFASKVAQSMGMNLTGNELKQFGQMLEARLNMGPAGGNITEAQTQAFLKSHNAQNTDMGSLDSAVVSTMQTTAQDSTQSNWNLTEDERAALTEANEAAISYGRASDYSKQESEQQSRNAQTIATTGGSGFNAWQQMASRDPIAMQSNVGVRNHMRSQWQSALAEYNASVSPDQQVSQSQFNQMMDSWFDNADKYAAANHGAIGVKSGESTFAALMKTHGSTINGLQDNQAPIDGVSGAVASELMRNGLSNFIEDLYGQNETVSSGDLAHLVDQGIQTYGAEAANRGAATTPKPLSTDIPDADYKPFAAQAKNYIEGMTGMTLSELGLNGQGTNSQNATSLVQGAVISTLNHLDEQKAGLMSIINSDDASDAQKALASSQLSQVENDIALASSIDTSPKGGKAGIADAQTSLNILQGLKSLGDSSSTVSSKVQSTQNDVSGETQDIEASRTNNDSTFMRGVFGQGGVMKPMVTEGPNGEVNSLVQAFKLAQGDDPIARNQGDALFRAHLRMGHDQTMPLGRSGDGWQKQTNPALDFYNSRSKQVGPALAMADTLNHFGYSQQGVFTELAAIEAGKKGADAFFDIFSGGDNDTPAKGKAKGKGKGSILERAQGAVNAAGSAGQIGYVGENMVSNAKHRNTGVGDASKMLASEVENLLNNGSQGQVRAVLDMYDGWSDDKGTPAVQKSDGGYTVNRQAFTDLYTQSNGVDDPTSGMLTMHINELSTIKKGR